MLDAVAISPEALISGIRDPAQMPVGRRRGRAITDFWVRIHVLGNALTDSMCGFRVYPLKRTLEMLESQKVGERMDFDIEILVKSHWNQIEIAEVPIQVSYDTEEPSNFKLFGDNVAISAMHTRLFFGMLRRLPRRLVTLLVNVLLRKNPRANSESTLS